MSDTVTLVDDCARGGIDSGFLPKVLCHSVREDACASFTGRSPSFFSASVRLMFVVVCGVSWNLAVLSSRGSLLHDTLMNDVVRWSRRGPDLKIHARTKLAGPRVRCLVSLGYDRHGKMIVALWTHSFSFHGRHSLFHLVQVLRPVVFSTCELWRGGSRT